MPVTLSSQDLVAILESLGGKFLLYRWDAGSQTRHESAALKGVMAEDPQRARIQRELDQMLADLRPDGDQSVTPGVAAVKTPLVREVVAARGRYSLRGEYIGTSASGVNASILITMSEVVADPLSDEVLQERFRLSKRECEIACLLTKGRSNTEIAEELRLSPHTVHHYTDRILLKLGVRNRTEIAAMILQL